jgi:hypothetical protein
MNTPRPRTYEAKINGRKRRVTVPDDPDPRQLLIEAIQNNLSTHAVAAIAGHLQPVRTQVLSKKSDMEAEVVRQVRWFAELLTDVVGGEDELNRLCEL